MRHEQGHWTQERQRQAETDRAELERLQRISEERLTEFVGLMKGAGVPKITIYVEEKRTPPGYNKYSSRQISPMGYTRLGEGWIVQRHGEVTIDDSLQDGLFVCADHKVYGCGRTSQEPPNSAAERYKRVWQEGEYTLANFRHEHGTPFPTTMVAKP